LFDSESLLLHGKSPFLGYQILPEMDDLSDRSASAAKPLIRAGDSPVARDAVAGIDR